MSTPKRYVDALKKEQTAWPVHSGDFFRYFEKPGDGYWSGFYTSRPAFKKQIRDASSLFLASSNVFGMSMIDASLNNESKSGYF